MGLNAKSRATKRPRGLLATPEGPTKSAKSGPPVNIRLW